MFSNLSPLFYLIHLKNKAWFRHILYSFFSIKRALFTLVAICMILLWLLPQLLITGSHGLPPVESVRLFMPAFFLFFFTMNLTTIQKEAALSFEPSEIGFLFAGPFSRRDLLLYKLIDHLKKLFFSALIFSVVANRWSPYWISSFVGFFMLLSFLTLLDIAVVLLLQSSWMDRRFTWGVVGVAIIAVLVFYWADFGPVQSILNSDESNTLTKYLKAFDATWFGSLLLAPFKVFACLITARSLFPEWITYASIAVAINVGLILLLFQLDKNYIEISLEISQRFYARRQKAMHGGIFGQANSKKSIARRVGSLPWWGGAGPVAWRQLTGAYRQWPAMLRLLLFMLLFMGPIVVFSNFGSRGSAVAAVIPLAVFSFIFFTQQIRFDFRSDLDQIEWLKQLPLNPFAVVAGQLITPSLFLITAVMLISLVFLYSGEVMAWFALIAFAVPVGISMYAIENFFFLLFPIKVQPNSAGDFQFLGRIYLLMLLKMIVVGVCGGLSFGVGYGAAFLAKGLSGGHLNDFMFYLVLLSVSWVGCVLWMLVLYVMTVWAYQRFDLTVDRPA